jgi:dihydroorotate dehydrogenase electron transfer subunit
VDHVAPSCAARRVVSVLENVRVARDTFRLRLDDPEMARDIRPGQFIMIRPTRGFDPLLGRPLALYDVIRNAKGEPIALDVVYFVLGRGTAALSQVRAGDRIEVWGPLGNGFGEAPGGDVICVAGGIGQTPFLALGKWWLGHSSYASITYSQSRSANVTMLWGVRSADLLASLDDFAIANIEVEIATDDGSAGHQGFVTDLLKARLARGERPAKLIGCGPPPMLKALAMIADHYAIDCDLSLENHMACGFGACFSCVAPILQDDGSSDLRRVCVEGPIFPAGKVVFA